MSRLMAAKRIHVKGARVLVLGITFKENCPDIRNSKVADVVRELRKQGARVEVYDPWASAAECRHEYGFAPVQRLKANRYDAAVMRCAGDPASLQEAGEPLLRRQAKIGEHGGRGMDEAAGRAPAHGAMAGDHLPERAFHLIAHGAAEAAAGRPCSRHQTLESGWAAFLRAMKSCSA